MLSLRLTLLTIKKKKESCIVLTLFILLSVLFMNLGITVDRQSHQIYFNECDLINSPHFIAPCNTNSYRDIYGDYISSYPGVTAFEKQEAVFMPTSKNNKNNLELGAFLLNISEPRSIGRLLLVEEDPDVPKDQAIYVSIQLKNQNVALGSDYTLTYKGSSYSFRVAGYFETSYYGNTSGGMYEYYVYPDTYQKLASDIGRCYLLTARFAGSESEVMQTSASLKKDFLKETPFSSSRGSILMDVLSYDNLKENATQSIQVGVALLCSVAILICLVILIIILNTIRENLREDMVSIGVLESMGYTCRQLMLSYSLEYILLVVIGSILGIISSYLCIPLVRTILSGICGFQWRPFYHPFEDALCFLTALAIIIITCVIAVRKLHSLTLVDALSHRDHNAQNHHNTLPLHKGFGSIHLNLALKQIFLHGKSNLVYAIIVAIGSFTVAITLILFLNFSLDHSKMLGTTGYELSDLQVTVTSGTDANPLAQELLAYDEVRKVNLENMNSLLKYEENTVKTIVSDHFEEMEVIHPNPGSFPVNENEVVLSYQLSQHSGKSVGDSIVLSYQGFAKTYLVCGIYSSMNGEMVLMNLAGMLALDPNYQINAVDLYLEPGISPAVFEKKLQSDYKINADNESSSIAERKIAKLLADYDVTSVSFSVWQDGKEIFSGDSRAFKINDIQNMKAFATGQMKTYAKMLSSLVMIIFLTTILIIVCILRITLKTSIQNNRTEYGVFKSMGYTASDLVKQLSLSFLITSLVGALTGAVLASCCSRPLFQAVFTLMGVVQMEISPHLGTVLLFGFILSLILYGSSILIGWRIRKITPYELLTE